MDRFVQTRRIVDSLGAGASMLVLLALVGCSTGGGIGGTTGTGGHAGSGQGGQSGGGSGGQGQGGTGPAVCSGCSSNQLCVNGTCMNLPSQCPCPVESYCDLASNKCV